MFYVDTSAAAKLVLLERGSAALRRWLEAHGEYLCSSDLLRIELQRAVRRAAPEQMEQARMVLSAIMLLRMSSETCERAMRLEPTSLRSLDALHLASAMDVGDELEGIVTYDERLAEAAQANGIASISPR